MAALANAAPPQDRNEKRSVVRAVHRALAPRRRPPVSHDPRIPPVGSTLRRRLGERLIEVRVAKHGFVHDGQTFASLSAIARHVTGSRWNGLLFFGLTNRQRGSSGQRRQP